MNNYEDLLSSNEILSPPEVHEISENIKAEQQPILDRRKALFDHVQRLAAPSATKQALFAVITKDALFLNIFALLFWLITQGHVPFER